MAEKSLEQLQKMIQRSLDILEIQNVMGRHEYYKAAEMHEEELEEIWVQKTPGASFESADVGKFVGIEEIRKGYVDGHELRGKRNLEKMRELYPQIKDEDKNKWIGFSVMHTLTTPVIEVAGDGKTGKGAWVSPGHMTYLRGGKLTPCWFWERYGADFVKEDGKWKLWHLRVYCDFLTPYDKSWLETSLEPSPPPEEIPGFPKPTVPSSTPYERYSPFVVPRYEPRPPDPYETFDQTFSY